MSPTRTTANRMFLIVAWLVYAASTAPAADVPDSSFRFAQAGYRYEFPRDHGAHEKFRTEWWYYTGHLETEEGRRFGYELTFFRRGIPPDQIHTRPSRWSVDQLYLAHVAITDVSEGRFHFRDRVSRSGLGKAGADANRLRVWLDQWRAEASGQSGDQQTLDARADGMALSLTLSPLKPLVIHGEQAPRLPNTLSVNFPRVAAHDLLARIPEVCASTGAACHSGGTGISPTLRAMGLTAQTARGTIRLSVPCSKPTRVRNWCSISAESFSVSYNACH